MYFSSHSSDKQYFSSQKIDENVVFLATTQDKSGLTRQELQCVVTRNETLSGYRNCIMKSNRQYLKIQQTVLSLPDSPCQTVLEFLEIHARQFWNFSAFYSPLRPDQNHPAKRYMACGFRSEAVSHDFAVFLLIIAQLEVAALPESKEAYKII